MVPEDRDRNDALTAVLQLLATLYKRPLDDTTIAALTGLSPEGDWFLSDPAFAAGFSKLIGFYEGADETRKLDARNDFHKLFVGPLDLLAAPWSSVYMDTGMLFGPSEREVRREFRSHGVDIPEGVGEPCDSMAYELQFLADLHKCGELDDARAFKERYLDPWSAAFLDLLETRARTDVYRGLAAMTRRALELEKAFLEQAA